MKHKWSKEIHAIADGIDVQRSLDNGIRWEDFDPEIHMSPIESKNSIWRIKPEPKPKPYSWGGVTTIPEDAVFINPHTKRPRDARDVFSDPYGLLIADVKPEPKPDVVRYAFIDSCAHFGRNHHKDGDNVMFVWDGESGALKVAEVLS